MLKRFLKGLVYVLLAAVLLVVLLITVATISDYTPPQKQLITFTDNPSAICDTCTYTMLIWNIGYCGMGRDMDFFYDGGRRVRTDEETTLKNCDEVLRFLQRHDSVQFLLLQEVDVRAKRSYYRNQLEQIDQILPGRHFYFAKNYDVFFVPVPVTEPYGRVKAGLLSLSKYEAREAARHAFPGNYAWPKRLFMLDRCFLVKRYTLPGGRELVVVNTHNSAYDDGTLRSRQLDYLKDFLKREYEQNNFVIVGGDWNQCPPSFRAEYTGQPFAHEQATFIGDNYLPGWQWGFDATAPSNRLVDEIYEEGKTPTTVIDFYLTSPNIDIIEVKTHDLQFENSDHNPVFLTFRLRGDKTNES